MASITIKRLAGPTQITAAAVTQYTAPAATTTRVMEILVSNTDTVERTYTISFIASGGTQGATNTLFSAVPIGPGETQVLTLDTTLNTGDFISALASVAAKVNMYISGAELQ
jgi:hypothetical protein